jgi:hypothetical protein
LQRRDKSFQKALSRKFIWRKSFFWKFFDLLCKFEILI